MSFVCHLYVIRIYSYVTRMSFVCHPYVTRMSSVCHSYALPCHSYVIRMHSYVICMSLVCTHMSFVCDSYVLVCHSYVTRLWFYHEPGKGLACYIRSDISYKLNHFLPNKIENITFDIFMPHTKPVTIGIIYIHPNQSKFLDIFEENLPKLNTSYREIYFVGDFNINLFENGK